MSQDIVQVTVITVKTVRTDERGLVIADGPPQLVTLYSSKADPARLYFTSKADVLSNPMEQNKWIAGPFGGFYIWDTNLKAVVWGITASDWKQNVIASLSTSITPGTESSTLPSIGSGPSSTTIAPPSASQGSGSLPQQTGAPSQESTSNPRNSDGLASGAVAGIAIACVFAGALIAGLLFWFCWRKPKPSRSRDYEASNIALVPQEKGFATKATSLGGGTMTSSPASGALPLPLEDKAISGEISKISNSIKNHVQSYYHSSHVSQGLLDLDDIQAIGSSLPISAGTLSTLLGNSATREIALRFCIAWLLCSRILPNADSVTSLLPLEVAGCSDKIAKANGSSNSQTPLVTRWRILTAELLQPSYTRDAFGASDSRNSSVKATLDDLENILRPYADSRMNNTERKRNLEEIIKRSATFAFTLFSQPSEWDFDWMEEQSVKSGELCIFPALLQLSDETGQAVRPPRPFSEAVVRRLRD